MPQTPPDQSEKSQVPAVPSQPAQPIPTPEAEVKIEEKQEINKEEVEQQEELSQPKPPAPKRAPRNAALMARKNLAISIIMVDGDHSSASPQNNESNEGPQESAVKRDDMLARSFICLDQDAFIKQIKEEELLERRMSMVRKMPLPAPPPGGKPSPASAPAAIPESPQSATADPPQRPARTPTKPSGVQTQAPAVPKKLRTLTSASNQTVVSDFLKHVLFLFYFIFFVDFFSKFWVKKGKRI